MSCPHSTRFDVTPASCSQCLMKPARRVTYDADTRSMMLDGIPVTRTVEGVAVARGTDAEVNSPPNAGQQTGGRRQRTCGLCGLVGHTRHTCNRQASTSSGTEAMVADDPRTN